MRIAHMNVFEIFFVIQVFYCTSGKLRTNLLPSMALRAKLVGVEYRRLPKCLLPVSRYRYYLCSKSIESIISAVVIVNKVDAKIFFMVALSMRTEDRQLNSSM